MEITQLRHFLAAAKYGSLVKAAEEQNITQSGLSRSITNLERRLDMPLLERSGKGLIPTPFGMSLIPHAKLILNQTTRAAIELQSIKEMGVGRVLMGVTLNYSHYFIPNVMNKIFGELPGVQIQIESGSFAELVEGVGQNRLDFLFGLIGFEDSIASLTVEELFATRSLIVCNRNHPILGEDDIGLSHLSDAQWAMLSGANFQKTFIDYFTSNDVSIPHQVLRTNSLGLLRHAVHTNDFLTILPRELVAQDLDNGTLVVVSGGMDMESTPAALVYKSDAIFTPAIEFVMDKIRAYASTVHEKDGECEARRLMRLKDAQDGVTTLQQVVD